MSRFSLRPRSPRQSRAWFYIAALLAASLGTGFAVILPDLLLKSGMFDTNRAEGEDSSGPIRVGVLHSLTGTMAVSERPVADATLHAIEEINATGGLLGRRVEPVLVDGASDWDRFAREADDLVTRHQVSAVFGCWTSACRKTVRPVFERLDHVLFYPVQYEGLEQSPNIVYAGAAPNQQIIPATKWAMDHLGHRIFIVGSDYVFPRTAGEIIRAQVTALQGEILGEIYRPLGDRDFTAAIAEIRAKKPDVIFNTINGDSNIAFYKALRGAGIAASDIPVMSFSLAETEIRAIGPELVVGDYAARNYFQSIDSPENRRFLKALRDHYGQDMLATAPMEAAYFSVLLWAGAVEASGSARYEIYRRKLLGQSLNTPEGIIYLDPDSRHVWRPVLIGKAMSDGNFEILWSSNRPVRPIPWPALRSRQEWDAFLLSLYRGWDNQWAAASDSSPSAAPSATLPADPDRTDFREIQP